jgi:hypothetical protein
MGVWVSKWAGLFHIHMNVEAIILNLEFDSFPFVFG